MNCFLMLPLVLEDVFSFKLEHMKGNIGMVHWKRRLTARDPIHGLGVDTVNIAGPVVRSIIQFRGPAVRNPIR